MCQNSSLKGIRWGGLGGTPLGKWTGKTLNGKERGNKKP